MAPSTVLAIYIFTLGIIYILSLLFLIFFNTPYECKQWMKIFDSSLGSPITMKNFALDCSLTFSNVISVFDRFLVAHFLGWFFAAMVLRKDKDKDQSKNKPINLIVTVLGEFKIYFCNNDCLFFSI